jgi:predicted RNase H-like HicB family nuclease
MKQRTYSIVLEPEEGGGYAVTVPALPGCFSQGKTVEEAMERSAEAISVQIAGLEADGEAVPEEREPPRLATVTVAA